ncbi:Gfo/Idh/MocA family protein [Nibricoccus sp. IMCC34717]|uniref:Gfo/Idh/MocA family protein n=1 Tax=Nibricoccus sp. IMCC34717 TaxID=3034021 RepID=UPI00384F541B
MYSRRQFIRSTSLLAASTALVPWDRLLGDEINPDNSPYKNLVLGRKVRVAGVGLGGKGYSDVHGADEEEIVALCDVDFERGGQLFREYPNVPRYRDFRRMLDEMHDKIDAVTVSTPDHMHFPIALMAIERGKHVYVQKPLTHTIGEARALKAAAARMGVVTQMGNQGHANEGTRLVREWIESGAIGDVFEVNAWTNRPVWPQGIPWPEAGQNAPSTLDWNLWLGVAASRPFMPGIAPFNWRGFWDYGCGALGDMSCHLLDASFWTLNFRGPCKVSATSEGGSSIIAPKGSAVRWEFPARGHLPPCVVTWNDGTMFPKEVPAELEGRDLSTEGGVIYRGTKGMIYSPGSYSESPRLVPEARMASLKRPAKVYPRIPKSNPHTEWIRAIKGGAKPGSNFIDHSADLTEFAALGNVAIRLGKPFEWDPIAGKCVGLPEADALIHKNYRAF